jgi:glycosyltransferase involved in cell wall biosynthesis
MVAYTFYETDNRVRRYAETLARRGDTVDAIVLRRPGQPEFEVLEGVNVHRIQSRTRNEGAPVRYLIKLLIFLFRSAWVLTARHLRHSYDIIHVHSVPDFEVFATLGARLLGARIILDIHDIIPEFYASKFRVSQTSMIFRALLAVEKLSTGYADHVIIANDLWHSKLTARAVRPEKCTAILNYPDPLLFQMQTRREATENEFVMCYPGTLNFHQGVDIAIEAMSLIRDKAPQVKFLIIGDGPTSGQLREMIVQKRLENRVTLLPPVPMEQVARVMAGVDLGVVPKRADGFGNEAFSTKIMEFMASGVPVLAAATLVDQLYFNDRLLQFFQSGNAQDLANHIINLVNDPARRETLRANATEFIRENNWGVKKRIYVDIIDDLLQRQKPIRHDANAEAAAASADR